MDSENIEHLQNRLRIYTQLMKAYTVQVKLWIIVGSLCLCCENLSLGMKPTLPHNDMTSNANIIDLLSDRHIHMSLK